MSTTRERTRKSINESTYYDTHEDYTAEKKQAEYLADLRSWSTSALIGTFDRRYDEVIQIKLGRHEFTDEEIPIVLKGMIESMEDIATVLATERGVVNEKLAEFVIHD